MSLHYSDALLFSSCIWELQSSSILSCSFGSLPEIPGLFLISLDLHGMIFHNSSYFSVHRCPSLSQYSSEYLVPANAGVVRFRGNELRVGARHVCVYFWGSGGTAESQGIVEVSSILSCKFQSIEDLGRFTMAIFDEGLIIPTSLTLSFRVLPSSNTLRISPSLICSSSHVTLTIFGSSFPQLASCFVGLSKVRASVSSSRELSCSDIRFSEPGTYFVEITTGLNDEIVIGLAEVQVMSENLESILFLEPDVVSDRGGSVVAISSLKSSDWEVASAIIELVSSNGTRYQLQSPLSYKPPVFMSPPGLLEGDYGVFFTRIFGSVSCKSGRGSLKVAASPVLDNVLPGRLSMNGGIITVFGRGFLTTSPILFCKVGNQISSVSSLSNSVAICTVRPMIDLSVLMLSISVGFNSLEWFEWDRRLVITDPVTIRSVQASLANHSSVALTVSGENFLFVENAVRCVLGDGQTSVGKFFSNDTVACVFPFLKPGNLSLTLRWEAIGVSSRPFEYEFKYQNTRIILRTPPKVSRQKLSSVVVEVSRRDLISSVECIFDSSLRVKGDSLQGIVVCDAVGLSFGNHSVVIQFEAEISNAIEFEVVAESYVYTAVPSVVPQNCRSVLILGSGFFTYSGARCQCAFSGNVASARIINSSAVICDLPVLQEGSFAVSFSGDSGQSWASSSAGLSVVPSAKVLSVTPSQFLWSTLATRITIEGNRFSFTAEYTCQIGSNLCPAKWMSPEVLECTIPGCSDQTNRSITIFQSGIPITSSSVLQTSCVHRIKEIELWPENIPSFSTAFIRVVSLFKIISPDVLQFLRTCQCFVNEDLGQNLDWIDGIPHCKITPLHAGLHSMRISPSISHPSFVLNILYFRACVSAILSYQPKIISFATKVITVSGSFECGVDQIVRCRMFESVTSSVFVSPQSIVCPVPNTKPRHQNSSLVEISLNDGATFVSSPDSIKLVAAIQIFSLKPSIIPASTPILLTVQGQNFHSDAMPFCRISGKDVVSEFISPVQAQCPLEGAIIGN